MSKSDSKVKQLAKNIKADPDDIFSKFALALELLKRDKVQQAQLLFESVLEQDPGYVGVYYHLGKVYQMQGMTDRALTLYEQGITVATQQNELRTKSELSEAIEQLRYHIDED